MVGDKSVVQKVMSRVVSEANWVDTRRGGLELGQVRGREGKRQAGKPGGQTAIL